MIYNVFNLENKLYSVGIVPLNWLSETHNNVSAGNIANSEGRVPLRLLLYK